VSARPGVDTAFDEGQMKIGRKLANKLLNASKFVLSFDAGPGGDAAITEPVDLAMLSRLADLVEECTVAFDAYDYARALERTEARFWWFCDDHLELVKARAYGALGEARQASAVSALRLALGVLDRLFAPFLPFVTDEAWSWWQAGSVHAQPWPTSGEILLPGAPASDDLLEYSSWVLGEIRRAKTEARRSMRAPVERVVVRTNAKAAVTVALVADDLRGAGSVTEMLIEVAEGEPTVTVTLAAED
jgi:valyl-tRNA synthetase